MANNKPEPKLIRAAGAVAWRPGLGGEPEILLVHRKKYDDWSLPKGKTEPGEQLPVTATREVLEEGGAHLALGRRLVSVRYQVGGRPKRVHYWAARVTSTDGHAVPNAEVDQVAWVPAGQAASRVSYARDHGVLADFTARSAGTVPLILLRHAKAVGKSDWKRGDARRPLDDSGRADAKALAEVLDCFAPRAGSAPRVRLITSPAVRCVETLRPFAARIGAPLREEPSLSIHHSSVTDPADSVPSMAALIGEAIASGEPTVLCAHRENIAELQAAALAALGLSDVTPDGRAAAAPNGPAAATAAAAPGAAALGAMTTPDDLPKEWDTPLPTASFWVLNVLPAATAAAATAAAATAAAATAAAVAASAAAAPETAPGSASDATINDIVNRSSGLQTISAGSAPGTATAPATPVNINAAVNGSSGLEARSARAASETATGPATDPNINAVVNSSLNLEAASAGAASGTAPATDANINAIVKSSSGLEAASAGVVPEAPPAPSTPARRGWLRRWFARPVADVATVGETAAPSAPAAPSALLISADRYDLSET